MCDNSNTRLEMMNDCVNKVIYITFEKKTRVISKL